MTEFQLTKTKTKNHFNIDQNYSVYIREICQDFENMKKMFDSLRSSKDKQFKELTSGNFSDSVINHVANQSAVSQKIMELQMFNHLKNVRLICTPVQLPKFDSLFVKILNRRGSEGRKKDSDKK